MYLVITSKKNYFETKEALLKKIPGLIISSETQEDILEKFRNCEEFAVVEVKYNEMNLLSSDPLSMSLNFLNDIENGSAATGVFKEKNFNILMEEIEKRYPDVRWCSDHHPTKFFPKNIISSETCFALYSENNELTYTLLESVEISNKHRIEIEKTTETKCFQETDIISRYSKEEIEFIKRQAWMDEEHASAAIEIILIQLMFFLNNGTMLINDIDSLGYTESEVVTLFGKILEDLNRLKPLDYSSGILEGHE